MTYTLKKGKSVAEISTRGGQMVAYRYDSKDVLWTGDKQYWGEHAPLLFPICCRIKEGKIAVEGKQYEMPLHGFIRYVEFEATLVTDTHIELVAHSDEQTKSQYPFDFTVTITHDLTEDGFASTFKVQNDSDRAMVYCIGGHPGFCTGNIEDWQLIFNKPLDETLYLTTTEGNFMDLSLIHPRRLTTVFDLKYEDFDDDAFIAIEPKADAVRLINKNTGKGLEMTFGDFSVFAVWTAPKKRAPYICLEPWNGLPDFVDSTGNLEDKAYAQTLAPNESKTVGYTVKMV